MRRNKIAAAEELGPGLLQFTARGCEQVSVRDSEGTESEVEETTGMCSLKTKGQNVPEKTE